MTKMLENGYRCVVEGCTQPADWEISELGQDEADNLFTCREHLPILIRPGERPHLIRFIGGADFKKAFEDVKTSFPHCAQEFCENPAVWRFNIPWDPRFKAPYTFSSCEAHLNLHVGMIDRPYITTDLRTGVETQWEQLPGINADDMRVLRDLDPFRRRANTAVLEEGVDAKAKHLPFLCVLDEMRDLHMRKSADYSPGNDPHTNFREAEDMGISAFDGVLVRMSDKWSRIKSLQNKRRADTAPAVFEESLRDTLIDLAVYGVIALNLFDEQTATKVSRCVGEGCCGSFTADEECFCNPDPEAG